MDYPSLIQKLKARLQRPLPGIPAQEKMLSRVRPMPQTIPATARASAVLCLLFPVEELLHVLLIRRTEDQHAHSGQISFPGGRQDPEDANLRYTALREAQEEVGIISKEVTILGSLTSLYIPVSNYQVYPFVAFAEKRPVYNINRAEVAELLEIPAARLFAEENKFFTEVRPSSAPDLILKVPAYDIGNDLFVWGATAMMLSELEAIWQEIIA